MLKTSFGYFQNDGKEFVVTEVKTPRPLVNYSWNQIFISGINQYGGGEGVYKEQAIQYIDPKGRNLMIREGHRYFYLRDEKSGEVWSPGWHPVQKELDQFKCIHGLSYSIIESLFKNIQTRLRVFVPEKEPCEIWTVTLTSQRNEKALIKLYSFADWLLMGYPRYCDYYGMLRGEYFEDIHAAQGLNRAAEREHDVYDGFVASETKPSGFETSQEAFLGNLGSVHMPLGVKRGKLTNSLASCEKLASVLEHTITLGPGESRTLNIFIGASNGYEMTKGIVTRLSNPGVIENEFRALKERKQRMINWVKVKTPNERINYLINYWIKQQSQVYADMGSDNGRGFRDAMQLIWGTASYEPDYTRKMLIECLQHQFADGHTLRGWLPIDKHFYSDGPVWIVPVVDAYLRESGEYHFLDYKIPYYDEGEGTVWEHLMQGLRHNATDTGMHGLTKMHFGDWNDSMTGVGVEGKGESVWTSIATVYSAKIAADMARRVRRNEKEVKELNEIADSLTQAVNDHAWDGNWYLRAINDYGEKVGTHTEKEGKIYLLPQVWSIMAGIVDEKRRDHLYKMVDEYLETAYGSRVLYPAYTKYNPHIGRLTLMVPGIWENGTAYCHANGFKIVADCYGGRGNRAYTSFLKAMPDSKWNSSTHSGCEPYVLTNQFLGEENRRAGKSLWAWMTGSAGWYYKAMTEWIIGVRADYEGLLIDPCFPTEWEYCELERVFRDARYHVRISNPERLEKGNLEIKVDGERIEGNIVPIFKDNALHEVDVLMKSG